MRRLAALHREPPHDLIVLLLRPGVVGQQCRLVRCQRPALSQFSWGPLPLHDGMPSTPPRRTRGGGYSGKVPRTTRVGTYWQQRGGAPGSCTPTPVVGAWPTWPKCRCQKPNRHFIGGERRRRERGGRPVQAGSERAANERWQAVHFASGDTFPTTGPCWRARPDAGRDNHEVSCYGPSWGQPHGALGLPGTCGRRLGGAAATRSRSMPAHLRGETAHKRSASSGKRE